MSARIPPLVLIVTTTIALSACAPQRPKESFSKLTEEFVYTSLANSPVAATQVGYHRHDDLELDSMLDDFSPTAIERQRQWYQDLRLRLQQSVDENALPPEDRADLDIIHDQISLALLELQSIQNYRHNPTVYVELIGNALYTPFVLEYADKAARYRHIINRLKGIPAFAERAQLNLTNAPEIWTKVAIEENDGNIGLIDAEIRKQTPDELRAAYDEAAVPALAALRRLTEFLRTDLINRTADWRLGPGKYEQKFRYVIATDQPPGQILTAAEADMKSTRDEMFDIASQLNGGHSNARDVNGTIRRALDRIATRHATPETYFADARRDLAEATQFVREKDLLTLPARENLQVIETPEFMRGIYSVGGFNPAPALEPQLGAFYWITPIQTSWPKERIESKLREYNFYGLKILTIHEAMPGHYVQFEYANAVQPQLRRVLRAVFGNGPYVEGWAVYATDFMLEQGYLNNSPELRLTFLKHQLRVLANTILDVRLHTKGMTDQQALDLMINDAFQEREEATGKLQRAKLSSAQLPTYYVGWRDWKRLRNRVQAERGASYSLKVFNESSLREGAVPLPVLSRLLTGKSL
jgi:uncharacterized protein (DUF885 family)